MSENFARGDPRAWLVSTSVSDTLAQIARQRDQFLCDLPTDDLRPLIRDRWNLCKSVGIDPHSARAPDGLTREHIEEILRVDDFGHIGRQVADDFARVISGSGHCLVLADRSGRIFYAVGDDRVKAGLEEVNFIPGGLWTEEAVGPNGVGTALATAAPVFVWGPEHFCEGWQPWICYGSPVRDPVSGRVTGAVDISGPAPTRSEIAFNLTVTVARTIERSLGVRALQRQQALISEFLAATKRWPNDGIILVDEDGRILELNPRGMALLKRDVRTLMGYPLKDASPELDEFVQHCWKNGGTLERTTARYATQIHVHCSLTIVERKASGCLLILRAVEPSGLHGSPRFAGPMTVQPAVTFADIKGCHPDLMAALLKARTAAENDKTVLLTGETGTGKDLVAQAIHHASRRAGGPFVAINCAALPSELCASELFGYARGAFTGAKVDGSLGKFAQASGGTLFLDEISSMPFDLQATLLRAIETKSVTPLGSSRSQAVDVRVIAAANQELSTLVNRQRFRADLYYRLNVISVRCPPLRGRAEDILFLASCFLNQGCGEVGRTPLRLSEEVKNILVQHSWPGNVRELKNLCSRWIEEVETEVVSFYDLPSEMQVGSVPTTEEVSMADAEAQLIIRTIKECNNNISMVARRLGVSRATIYNKLRVIQARNQ